MNNPKISIITVCYNSAKTIAAAIESVKRQSYSNYEHIFIDGKSTDGTIDIIKRYSPGSILVSEKDNGLYDAMNKGYRLAHGDVIGTLNSDDFYLEDNILKTIAEHFNDSSIDYVCGKINFYDEKGRYSHTFGASPDLEENLKSMSVAHPSIYVRKLVVDAIGLYDVSYSISADFDWCLRLLLGKYKYYFINKSLVGMTWGGVSSNSHVESARQEYLIKTHIFPARSREFKMIYYKNILNGFVRRILVLAGLNSIVHIIRRYQGKIQ